MKTTTKLFIKIALLILIAFALGYAVHSFYFKPEMCLLPHAKLSVYGYYFV
jgi:hypothetical protein